MSNDDQRDRLNSLSRTYDAKTRSMISPLVKASFEVRGPLYVVPFIQNVGDTPAIDVYVELWFEPDGERKTLLFPVLMPHQKIKFLIPEANPKVLVEKFTLLKLRGKCKTILDRKIKIDDTMDIKKVLGSWVEGGILIEETIENRLSQVADRIERLERSVERMLASTSGVLVKTREDEKKEREEIKKFYEERKQKEVKKTST